ncbi:MAG: DUF938 domain-containing protein [Pseudomonadota bacterium]
MTRGDSRPWFGGGAPPDAKRHAPATARNRDAIVAVLESILPDDGHILEIASGSGEHIVYFARAFPQLRWQPSDLDSDCRASIAAWTADADIGTIAPPVKLDASAEAWPIDAVDAIMCINMIHISPWSATEGLLAGAGRVLKSGAPLYLYGPFRVPDRQTAPSNEEFDLSLKGRNPDWGLRDIRNVERAARRHALILDRTIDMPANNLSVIFRKT